jgi:hypothetical protein
LKDYIGSLDPDFNEMMNHEIEELCIFLTRLQHGEIWGDDALQILPSLSGFKTPGLKDLYGSLHHYIDDAAIRAEDPGYRDLQDSEMTKLIARLQSGDFAKANEVTFLSRT